MYNYLVNKILSYFLIVQIILVGWASRNPHWVEKYYSRGIYPEISGFLRRFFGWIPFSIGDLLYGLLVFVILKWIWHLYQTRFSPILTEIYRIGGFVSIIFFLFHFLWGMNYYRPPLYKSLGIESLAYDSISLEQTTLKHIDRINMIQRKINENDSIPVSVPYSRRKMYRMAYRKYQVFENDSLDFQFRIRSVKSSLISKPLSFMGFSGYLNPFTGESQVNHKIPLTSYPVTTTHEMAHQLGYASETEANYIGYLACVQHSDLYFQYSGELMAVRFLLHDIAAYNEPLAYEYYQLLDIGVQKNIQHSKDFWDGYNTTFKPFFQKFYDKFLKANKQTKGIRSYNAMVGYLVNY